MYNHMAQEQSEYQHLLSKQEEFVWINKLIFIFFGFVSEILFEHFMSF